MTATDHAYLFNVRYVDGLAIVTLPDGKTVTHTKECHRRIVEKIRKIILQNEP